jgi:membrane protein
LIGRIIRRIVPRPVRRFFTIAANANITGMSSMIAYNMILAVIPIALLALFVAGHVLASSGVQNRVVLDLQEIFPGTTDGTLDNLLGQVRNETTTVGVATIVSSLWLGSSFWGSLDTAFSRIYGGKSRPWLAKRRFALSMVVVVLLFMMATVAIPTIQRAGLKALPFDLAQVSIVIYAGSLAFGLALLFGCLLLIYFRVPHFKVPWKAVWPGALWSTVAIGIIDFAFPEYLSHISTIARFSSTFVFIVIVLGWFYVLALIILSGAIVNALRMRPPGPDD